jgi:glutathione S-transferase
MRWCFAALTTVEPTIQTIALMDFENKTDEVTRARRAALAKVADTRLLPGVEAWLGEREFITGAEFTVADILLTSVLRLARRVGLLAGSPRCEAYRLRCEARPAWGRTVERYESRLGAERGAVDRAAEPREPAPV